MAHVLRSANLDETGMCVSERRGHRPVRGAGAAWLVAAILAVSICAPAAAQQYRSDQPDTRAKANSGAVALCVRDPSNYATDKDRFTDYFQKYYFPAMTQYGPKDLEGLGSLRYDLFSRYLWKTQGKTIQDDLTKLAFQAMQQIVVGRNPPYHPAVRYNAMLVIGMLDEQYAIDSGANRRPPKPLPDANKFLVLAAKAGIEGKIPPALLVGALIGLERHAQYHESLTPEANQAMAAVVLTIIDRDEPIQDVDRDVYAWMQLQAANVLANLGTVGEGNRNLDGLMKLIAGGKSLDVRCEVAGLLPKVKLEGATVDGKPLADQLMKLAVDVARDEAKRARDFQDRHLRGAVRGGMYGQELTLERRPMLARLVKLRDGLQAVAPIAPDDVKAKLASIVAAIRPAADAAEDNDTIDLDLAAKAIQMAGDIQAAVGPQAAGGASS